MALSLWPVSIALMLLSLAFSSGLANSIELDSMVVAKVAAKVAAKVVAKVVATVFCIVFIIIPH